MTFSTRLSPSCSKFSRRFVQIAHTIEKKITTACKTILPCLKEKKINWVTIIILSLDNRTSHDVPVIKYDLSAWITLTGYSGFNRLACIEYSILVMILCFTLRPCYQRTSILNSLMINKSLLAYIRRQSSRTGKIGKSQGEDLVPTLNYGYRASE